jgi:hypothetical protein
MRFPYSTLCATVRSWYCLVVSSKLYALLNRIMLNQGDFERTPPFGQHQSPAFICVLDLIHQSL